MADMSVWHEVYSRGNIPKDDDYVDHHEPVAADIAGNVYSFGLLMLEIISGKPPYSEQKGSLVNLVMMTIINNLIVTEIWKFSHKASLSNINFYYLCSGFGVH